MDLRVLISRRVVICDGCGLEVTAFFLKRLFTVIQLNCIPTSLRASLPSVGKVMNRPISIWTSYSLKAWRETLFVTGAQMIAIVIRTPVTQMKNGVC
mmetsp:Transcript_31489/g.31972  ORF Transcript_31489/g.31972 Transcript_31489/m.31972 type:complete len:97 (+) Transcript_31489:62-352(+)